MATDFGISGINTGMDTNAIIEKLVALNQRPIDVIASKEKVEKQKLASFQDLKSRLQTFKSIATTLNTESRFLSTQGTFSNTSATATTKVVDITTTSQATSGVYSFTVSNLAKEGKIVSQSGFSSINSTISTGTFKITVGNTITNITIDSSNNTVEGLRLAINNSGANVTASFINDGSANPIRLMIAGTQTGSANTVSATMTGSGIGAAPENIIPFTQIQTAQDASLLVNGVSVTKSSNTVTDVIPGAILNLSSIGSGAITLSTDTTAVKQKINTFVNGYNDLMAYLKQQLAVDSNSNTGVLFGNVAVVNLQQALRDSITAPVAGVSGSYSFLSQVGIRTQNDGSLLVDDGELSTAIANNIGNVTQLFASMGRTSSTGVTYIGFTQNTVAGTYDVRVQNGVPQLSPTGQGNYTDAVGSGSFFAGATGTDAEGLNFRISTARDGSFGTITQIIGVAEKLNRILVNQTDLSRNGPLAAEINTANNTIADDEKAIAAQQVRLTQFTENLKAKFTNLEMVVGKLKSQAQAFSSALAGVGTTTTKK